ncbi:unnamed protein product [Effrenium voratum]|uniref:Tyrosine specific protein phosphatases domain-containing protein n=1 Tax=Effrenium voratum TaxID=2562239 RepID=A0AA36IFW1_9DINO|nr:unnamed protein product [Effrenium voratum]
MVTWLVVGGLDNGLLVREEADLKSRELGRLAHGALLLEEELVAERLRFQKLRGHGPKRGYCSVRIKGKELLSRCARVPAPETPLPSAAMEPLAVLHGMARWFPFRRVANFRDVADSHPGGGRIRCAGGVLRQRRLFRAGHLAAATAQDLELLKSLNVRSYVDLRDGLDFEGADAPVYDHFPPRPRDTTSKLQEGQRRRIWCPFSKDLKLRSWTAAEKSGLVPEWDRSAWVSWWYQRVTRMTMERKVDLNIPATLCALNRAILFINSDEVLKAMRALSEEQNYPVLFGCVAGKDRTGLLACLVLSVLEVDKDIIMADYLKTNLAAEHINACAQVGTALWWRQLEQEDPKRWQMMQRNGQVQRLKYDASWPGLTGSEDEFAQVFPAVFRDTMAYTLQMLEEEGGALAYLSSIGFGPEDLQKLRRCLVEPA